MIVLSRVPLSYCLKRAGLVLPFSLMAVAVALGGRWIAEAEFSSGMSTAAASGIVGKSYLSALSILLLAGHHTAVGLAPGAGAAAGAGLIF